MSKEHKIFEEKLIHTELDFLKNLEKYSFDSKMIICQKFASRMMTTSEVNMQEAYNQNVMPWELEVFAAFSVIYDVETADHEIEEKDFFNFITKIRNFWHPELTIAKEHGVYSDVFLMISALQQFPVQGVFLQKLFRYNYFFNFCNSEVDMKMEFEKKFHTSYFDFELFAYIVFVYFSRDAQKKGQPKDLQKILSKAFNKDDVFKQLCIEKKDYKKNLLDLYHNNILDYYYGLKIQYVYPLISGTEYVYIPSPYLVINAVTESLLNRLTLGNKGLRDKLGKEIIENYLFDIYKEIPSVTWISREILYKVKKSPKLTSDVLVGEGDYCIFYDTKSLSPSLKIRKFEKEEIDKEIELYAHGIIQIYQQILNYTQGYFQTDKKYDKDKIFGVVVVLEDAILPREKVYKKAFELFNEHVDNIEINYIHSHIKVVSLREIESMVLQNKSFLSCLIKQEKSPADWDNLSYSKPSLECGLLPIYEKYVTRIKNSVTEYLKQV